MAGPPVIQPKVGAVKAPEPSPYYSIYIGRSLRAGLLGLLYSHTLILSRSKQDRGSNTVFLPSKNTGFLSSPLVTDPDVSPSAGEGEEGSV